MMENKIKRNVYQVELRQLLRKREDNENISSLETSCETVSEKLKVLK